MAVYTDPRIFDAAAKTLIVMKAAVPIDEGDMFPDYHDADNLAKRMIESLLEWPTGPLSQNVNGEFVQRPLQHFRANNVRKGMQCAAECVHYFLGDDKCGWGYAPLY